MLWVPPVPFPENKNKPQGQRALESILKALKKKDEIWKKRRKKKLHPVSKKKCQFDMFSQVFGWSAAFDFFSPSGVGLERNRISAFKLFF